MDEDTEFNVDDFMSTDFGDLPETARKDLEGGKVGYSYKEVLAKHTTDAGRKLIGNMRSALTKSQQEAAELRKLKAEMEDQLLTERKKTLSNYDRVKAIADENIDGLDLYEDGNLTKALDVKAARLQKLSLDERRKELEFQEEQLNAKRFIEKNPELKDPEFKNLYIEIAYQKKAMGQKMDAEDLLLLTKGKLVQSAAAREEAARLAKHDQTVDKKKSANTTSVHSMTNTNKRPPKGLSGVQLYKWYEANLD